MGVCGCTDKSSRTGTKNIIGSSSGVNHEGGEQNNSMTFEEL